MHDRWCEQTELEHAHTGQMIEYAVTPRLVLAGQPQRGDWSRLVARGFHTVINLRTDPQRAVEQMGAAEGVGLRYIHLPLPAYELEPEHVAEFDAVMDRCGAGKILLHCRSATRVAVLWLLKRMFHDGLSREQAEAELVAAGYDGDSMETFRFCADDYVERTGAPAPGPVA